MLNNELKDEISTMGILEIKELMQHGKYNEVLEEIDELGEEDKL